ncbi:heme-binding protein [Pararhizobium polonicum]|nr:heme-binding protein [Pararhizobium polonicum]
MDNIARSRSGIKHLEAEQRGYDFNSRFRLPESGFAASGGGFPLMLRGGTMIGTVGVSGLPDLEDHLLVTNALRELLTLGH